MKKRRVLFILFILLLALGVAANQFLVMKLQSEIEESIREESMYPVKIGSLLGIIPLGRFWVNDAQFLTPMEGASVEWTIPRGALDLKATSAAKPVWEVRNLHLQGLRPLVKTDDGKLSVEAVLEVVGKSTDSLPAGLPTAAIWCQSLTLTAPAIQSTWEGKELGTLHETRLELSPYAFATEEGEFITPFDFSLESHVTSNKEKGKLAVAGSMVPAQDQLTTDIQLLAFDPVALDQVMASASRLLIEMRDEKASDYIREGSFSIRLRADANPRMVKGDLTLRLAGLQFGDLIRETQFAGDSTDQILGLFEKKTDAIQLGPVPFTEDLSTPDSEAVEQLQKGLLAEAARAALGSGIQQGLGLFKGLMGR